MRHRDRRTQCHSVGPVGCSSCDLHDICRLGGLIAFDTGRSRQSTGALRTVSCGTHLYRAGDPAQMLYAVRQGMLKTVHVTPEGDEQVLALNIPGEVLGLEAFSTGVYAADVIALQPVVCCELPLRMVREQGVRANDFDTALVQLLSRAAAPKPSPARGAIRDRVTRFLLDLGSRLGSRGLRFAYEVRKGEEKLVTGATEHIWIDKATSRPCRTPEMLREPFERLAGMLA